MRRYKKTKTRCGNASAYDFGRQSLGEGWEVKISEKIPAIAAGNVASFRLTPNLSNSDGQMSKMT